MNLFENIAVGFRGLRANGLRSALTVLGIFIGVLAVILGTAIGQGSRVKILESVQSLGANSVIIFSSQDMEGKAAGYVARLSLKDVRVLKEKCPTLVQVSASFTGNAKLKYGRKTNGAQISCATPELLSIRDVNIQTGRSITEKDVRGRRKVVVLGNALSVKLFGDRMDEAAMIGKIVRVQGIGFRVIGVAKKKGAALFDNLDEYAYVPLTTGMKTLFGAKDPSEIYAQIPSDDKADAAKEEITKAMRISHRLKAGTKDDFQIFTQQQLMSIGNTIGGILTGLLSGIAAVALLVGGIGIMNIMLVSVTERTREIGIRKAIGARSRDIRLQFLVEAMTLSIFGGVTGILMGVLISLMVNKFLHFPASVSPFWAFVAFSVSAAIGIFFGLYPASKAAKLDPIDALRYQ